mgnify:CR=1 FL=1
MFDYYNALIAEKENKTVSTDRQDNGKVATRSGNGKAMFERVYLCDAAGQSVEYIGVGQQVELVAEVRAAAELPRLVFGYALRDRLGQLLDHRQRGAHIVLLAQQHRLGQLQAKQRRSQSRRSQCGTDVLCQARLVELARRNIHPHRHRAPVRRRRPPDGILAGPLQDPATHGHHEAR